MFSRRFKLDDTSITLPKGTHVCLRVDLKGDDGHLHAAASGAVVREVAHHTYVLETPSGRRLSAQRDQIVIQRRELLGDLGVRQWDWRRLEQEIIYSAVVGSHAWGLAGKHSDEDVRGCFVLPFEEISGLWEMPDEIQDPGGDAAHWEVEKLVVQGLRGDANTLETLWSPLVKECNVLGRDLVQRREMFVSMHILGSFGRYAQSQFKKIERSLERDAATGVLLDAIDQGQVTTMEDAATLLLELGLVDSPAAAHQEVRGLCRSFFDRGLTGTTDFGGVMAAMERGHREGLRPAAHRPKNAYNLLRLLHSCLHWLRHGEPLMAITGPLRQELLAIKAQQTPIEQVVEQAKGLAQEVEEAAKDATLPPHPDYDAAHEFLKRCRRHAAARSFGIALPHPTSALTSSQPALCWVHELTPVPLPPDIDLPALGRFLREQLANLDGQILWVALTGAHTYGFPSPDSDLDLKGVFLHPAQRLLGLGVSPTSDDRIVQREGREYDWTVNELQKVASLLLGGNGNAFERLLGPMPLVTTAHGHELARLARGALSQRVVHHYRGFFRGMQREAALQASNQALSAKTLLYAYRVSLTGAHLLRTGELVTDVRPLAQEAGFGFVEQLIAIKCQAEYVTIAPQMLARAQEDFGALDARLDDALACSVLPQQAQNAEALDRWIVATRIELMQATGQTR